MAKRQKPVPTQTEIFAWYLLEKSEQDEGANARDFHRWIQEFWELDNYELYRRFWKQYKVFQKRYRRPHKGLLPK